MTRPERVADLIRFHSTQKYRLLAHSPVAYAELGRLVAQVTPATLDDDFDRYQRIFNDAVAVAPTRQRHVNALQHMAGYFRRVLDLESRREVESTIALYESGHATLRQAKALIRRRATEHNLSYLLDQAYLVDD